MTMSPQRAERLYRSAFVHHKSGRLYHALKLYRAILVGRPGYAPALHHAALATAKIRQHARAQGKPFDDKAELRMIVAAVASAAQLSEMAEQRDRAAFWGTGNAYAHARLGLAAMVHNYAKFQMDRGVLEGDDGARGLFEASLELNPILSEGWTNVGNVYAELGDRMRSEAAYVRALECPIIEPETQYNMAFLRLMKGDYEQGWRDYEARWQVPEFLVSYDRPDLKAPRWNGEPFDGTLYLHGEQGAGDVVMMARYIPLVRQRCRVIVEVLEGLVTYFAATFPDVQIVRRGDPVPPHDQQLAMMSLPAVFGTSIATVPPPVPTHFDGIEQDPTKIGVCWKGSATHVNDRNRSMPIAELGPLLAMEGYRWQSLQFGVDDVAGLDPLISTDYLDTCKVIASCGLVITVDTSIAHLAATLGVETWILLPYHAEFRWMQDRTGTPWYPWATLWRQRAPRAWADLITDVGLSLKIRRMNQPTKEETT